MDKIKIKCKGDARVTPLFNEVAICRRKKKKRLNYKIINDIMM